MCIKGPVRAASKGLWTAGIGFTAGLGTWRSSRRPGERQGNNFDKKVGKMVDKKARTVWGATASVPHKTAEPLTCDSIHMELNEKKTTSIDLASFGRKMVFSRWHFQDWYFSGLPFFSEITGLFDRGSYSSTVCCPHTPNSILTCR